MASALLKTVNIQTAARTGAACVKGDPPGLDIPMRLREAESWPMKVLFGGRYTDDAVGRPRLSARGAGTQGNERQARSNETGKESNCGSAA